MRRTAISAALIAGLTLPVAAEAFDFQHAFAPRIAAATAIAPPTTCARLYAFTGLGGQVPGYSLGVFAEVDKIAKAFPCVRTYKRAWTDKTATWATAKANYQIDGLPIFLIGHSKGADAALAIARWLANDSIPVATVFSYDPTRTQSGCVSSNVLTFINWRGTRFLNLGRGNPQRCAGNTSTAMQDYPLNVAHVLLDDLPTVHALTTKHVGEVLHMVDEMRPKKGAGTINGTETSAARRRSRAEICSLSPRGRGLWSKIKRAFPDAKCISGYRPGARMPSGQRSHHATGDAIDWTTSRMAAGVAWSRANAPGMTIVYASGHIHSDVGSWRGFARR